MAEALSRLTRRRWPPDFSNSPPTGSAGEKKEKPNMKAKTLIVLFTTLLWMCPSLGQPSIKESFEALKSLAGEWRGNDTMGHQAEIRFRVTRGGTALVSELVEPNHQAQSLEDDMITMIHLDGDRLLLTHYCGADNQPRMK